MVTPPESARCAQDLTLAQLAEWLAGQGEPAYRARQVWQWLHVHGVMAAEQMTNLPAGLRDKLAQAFDFAPLAMAAKRESQDRSRKIASRTRKGHPVEAVWMPGGTGGTAVCLSSHSGCGLGCVFCQTGYLGQLEALSAGQILAQVYLTEQLAGERCERVVLMGMGEPLLNLGAVRQVVETLCDGQARAWAPKRITISTVGLVKPLLKLAETFPRVNLALSLHFTTAEQRRQYMPKAEPRLEELVEALAEFRTINGGKLTLEYMVLAGINHSEADARRLADLTRQITDGTASHAPGRHTPIVINLLPYNPILTAPDFRPATEDQLNRFAKQLVALHQTVTIRRSRGQDIGAACGQLGAALKQ